MVCRALRMALLRCPIRATPLSTALKDHSTMALRPTFSRSQARPLPIGDASTVLRREAQAGTATDTSSDGRCEVRQGTCAHLTDEPPPDPPASELARRPRLR